MVTNNSVNEPTAASGKILQGQGVGTASAFSTATYPATAIGTGKILRADGTNFVVTTATFPDTAGTSGNVLTSDGTNWSSATPAAGGNVTGAASSTDNALVRFDGTTGKIIQNGVITEDDTGNLSVAAAVSGGDLSALVSNTSNTASARAFYQAQVAGSTASDAFIETNISGGQAWTFGLDNSDSDAFALSSNATLGTTNVMRVATTGEINYPLQTAFLAYVNTTITNVTGDGTVYTVIFDTEVYDQNADFNLGTSTLTAPVTGNYSLYFSSLIIGGTVITQGNSRIVTSNRTYDNPMFNPNSITSTSSGVMSVIADMDAADTATFAVVSTDSGGKVDDVSGLTSTRLRNYVSGKLSC